MIAHTDEARMFVGAQAPGLALQAGVDQLEIKDGHGLCLYRSNTNQGAQYCAA